MAPQPAAGTAAARKRYFRKNHKFEVELRDPKDNGRDIGVRGQKMKKEENKKKAAKCLKLMDLPGDLLVRAILSGLHPADRMRFGVSCKKNHSLITTPGGGPEKSLGGLPWLATFRWRFSSAECRLYEPTHRPGEPPYATYEIKCPKEEVSHRMFNTVRASKLGWLLCSWTKEIVTLENTRPETTSFSVFSPFNRGFIKLPDLKDSVDYGQGHGRDNLLATFSSCPSLVDECIYFVLTQCVIPGKVTISTIRKQHQTEWKSMVFDQLIRGRIESVAYLDGLFYCVSSRGHLAAYDPFQEKWTVVVRRSSPLIINTNWLSWCRYLYVLEFNGKLLLVCHDSPATLNRGLLKDVCSLFELNSSTKTWVQKTSLEDGTIFLPGKAPAFAVSTAPSSDTANKIYFYGSRNSGPMYYSFKDAQSYLCQDGSSSSYCWSSAIPQAMWIQQLSTPPPPALSPS